MGFRERDAEVNQARGCVRAVVHVPMKLTCAILALTTLCAPAVAGAQQELRIRWYDAVGVPAGDAETARATASAILRRSRLDVTWRRCARNAGATGADPCADPLGPDEIMVRIIKTPPRGGIPRNALGYAHPEGQHKGGVLATVLVDRVKNTASAAGVAFGLLLGRVMVHEIGHLGTLTHSSSGLMCDHWTVDQLRDPGEWAFSSRESAQMQAAFSISDVAARR